MSRDACFGMNLPQSKKKNRADSVRFFVTERRYGTGAALAGSKGWQNHRNSKIFFICLSESHCHVDQSSFPCISPKNA
jgi:hypothetical protein